jgi:hypothetical protein
MNLNTSAAAIADGHLLSFDNDRHVASSGRGGKHGIHVLGALLDVHVFMVRVGRPGPFRVRSARLAVDNDFRAHVMAPFD